MEPLAPPHPPLFDKLFGHDVESSFTTTVRVTGRAAALGRAVGIARSDDGELQLELQMPESFGESPEGSSSGKLFAASYASCFHATLILLGAKAGIDMSYAVVRVAASYSRDLRDGLDLLGADVEVDLPNVQRHIGEALVKDAERICPYARLARHGIRCVIVESAPAHGDERSSAWTADEDLEN